MVPQLNQQQIKKVRPIVFRFYQAAACAVYEMYQQGIRLEEALAKHGIVLENPLKGDISKIGKGNGNGNRRS